jgi:hypothetical protein
MVELELLDPSLIRVINPQDTSFDGVPMSKFLSTIVLPNVVVLSHWSVPPIVSDGVDGHWDSPLIVHFDSGAVHGGGSAVGLECHLARSRGRPLL